MNAIKSLINKSKTKETSGNTSATATTSNPALNSDTLKQMDKQLAQGQQKSGGGLVSSLIKGVVGEKLTEQEKIAKQRAKANAEKERMLKSLLKYTIDFSDVKDSSQKGLLEAYQRNDMDTFVKYWGYDANGLKVKSDITTVKDPNFIVKAKTKSELDLFKTKDQQLNILILSVVDLKMDFLKLIMMHPRIKLNMRDQRGVNALWHACRRQSVEILKFLLNYRIKEKPRMDKVYFDPTYQDTDEGMNCLQFLVYVENIPMIEMLIQKAKTNSLQTWNEKYKAFDPLTNRQFINLSKRNGVTTLQLAILKRNVDMVKYLTQHGADVNMQDPISTACPLYLAMKVKAPTNLIDHLLYYSYPQIPKITHPNRRDIEMSPLFLAIKQRDIPLLKKLIELGHQKKQLEFMITTTTNGLPPLYYTLLRMEKLLDQARRMTRGDKVIVNEKEKYMNLSELQQQLVDLQYISDYLIKYDATIVMEAKQKQDQIQKPDQTPKPKIDIIHLRNLYNKEIEPGINILWKTMQLANYSVATLLLDSGLASVDYQMESDGQTCLMKALIEDVNTDNSVSINNEKDREEIIRFLIEDGEDWWADPEMKDAQGNDCFHHSKELAQKNEIQDYMEMFKDAIEENKTRSSELQTETRPPPFVLKAPEQKKEEKKEESPKKEGEQPIVVQKEGVVAAPEKKETPASVENKGEDGKAGFESEQEKKIQKKKKLKPEMREDVKYKNDKLKKLNKPKIVKPLYESEDYFQVQKQQVTFIKRDIVNTVEVGDYDLPPNQQQKKELPPPIKTTTDQRNLDGNIEPKDSHLNDKAGAKKGSQESKNQQPKDAEIVFTSSQEKPMAIKNAAKPKEQPVEVQKQEKQKNLQKDRGPYEDKNKEVTAAKSESSHAGMNPVGTPHANSDAQKGAQAQRQPPAQKREIVSISKLMENDDLFKNSVMKLDLFTNNELTELKNPVRKPIPTKKMQAMALLNGSQITDEDEVVQVNESSGTFSNTQSNQRREYKLNQALDILEDMKMRRNLVNKQGIYQGSRFTKITDDDDPQTPDKNTIPGAHDEFKQDQMQIRNLFKEKEVDPEERKFKMPKEEISLMKNQDGEYYTTNLKTSVINEPKLQQEIDEDKSNMIVEMINQQKQNLLKLSELKNTAKQLPEEKEQENIEVLKEINQKQKEFLDKNNQLGQYLQNVYSQFEIPHVGSYKSQRQLQTSTPNQMVRSTSAVNQKPQLQRVNSNNEEFKKNFNSQLNLKFDDLYRTENDASMDFDIKSSMQGSKIPTIKQKAKKHKNQPLELSEFQKTPIKNILKFEEEYHDYNILKSTKPQKIMGLPSLDIQIKYLEPEKPPEKAPRKISPPKLEEKKYISRKGDQQLTSSQPLLPKAEVRMNKGAVMLAEFNTNRFQLKKNIQQYGEDLKISKSNQAVSSKNNQHSQRLISSGMRSRKAGTLATHKNSINTNRLPPSGDLSMRKRSFDPVAQTGRNRGNNQADHGGANNSMYEGHTNTNTLGQRGKSATGAIDFLQKKGVVKTELLPAENFNSRLITSRQNDHPAATLQEAYATSQLLQQSAEDPDRGADPAGLMGSNDRYRQANSIAQFDQGKDEAGEGEGTEIWENSFILPQIVQYKDVPGKSPTKKLTRNRSHNNRHLHAHGPESRLGSRSTMIRRFDDGTHRSVHDSPSGAMSRNKKYVSQKVYLI